MKLNIVHLWFALLIAVVTSACADNDYTELDKGNTELALAVNNTSVILDEASHLENALEFSWTTGTNYGTGNKINYTLEVAEAGTSFANPVKLVDNETQVYSYQQTVEELNTFLTKHFGTKDGLTYKLEARVNATVADVEQAQTAIVAFTVTAYKPVTSTLFVKGTATNGDAQAMVRTDNGVFTWTGMLHAGTFTLTTNNSDDYPAYVNGNDGKLTLQQTADEKVGDPLEITDDHYYTLKVNLLTGELKIERTEGIKPAYDQLYLVGEMTGWGFEPMHQDVLDPFLFRLGYVFGKGGEFKFGTAQGSWENMYKATSANASYTDTSMEFVKGFDPDNKWKLKDSETGKAYKLCVDIRTGKERMLMRPFTPYSTIYLIGSAAPGGWSLDNATAMTPATDNPYVLTWSGQLNAGELKFSCDLQSDWNGAWFMPASDGSVPTGKEESMLFINKSDENFKAQYPDTNINGIDQKWNIRESGNYIITLNQLTETITILKK